MPEDRPPIVRPGEIDALGIDPGRPLLIVDVDEVLGLFIAGFEAFLASRGLEFRLERFALFQNIYRPGGVEHLDLAEGKRLYEDFFASYAGEIAPAPGAAKALQGLARKASVIILSNAPPQARLGRARWLARHGLDYPLVLGSGPKGPLAAALAARTARPSAFVDDLLPNLDSVAEAAPAAARFQHVADARLRLLAPAAPERHPRIDHWAELGEAIEATLRS